MFNKDELNYLLIAVNEAPVTDTASAKNKAFMLGKIAELMEMPEQPGTIVPEKEPEDNSASKKK